MPHTSQRRPRGRRNSRKLKIIQVNVGRGGAATDLALLHAFENHCDLLMVQEPWIDADLDRRLLKKHNAYQAYGLEEVWTDRPGVITYT